MGETDTKEEVFDLYVFDTQASYSRLRRLIKGMEKPITGYSNGVKAISKHTLKGLFEIESDSCSSGLVRVIENQIWAEGCDLDIEDALKEKRIDYTVGQILTSKKHFLSEDASPFKLKELRLSYGVIFHKL